MQSHALIALSQGWILSLGAIFIWFILVPAVMTGCIVVSIVSGRGEKSDDDENAGRWGRKPPPGHE